MRHHEVDQYARGSTLQSFDPRVKVVSTVLFIAALAFLRSLPPLALCLVFISSLLLYSRVPLGHLLRSYAITLPFIVFASLAILYSSGWEASLMMLLRISTSVLALLLLATTTPFFDLMKALRWFRLPSILASLILFTYRFIFVLIDEMERMNLARKARGFSGGRHILNLAALRTIAYTAGTILIRSHRRAEGIYSALLSRGYNGEIRTLSHHRAGTRDAILASLFVSVTIISISLQAGVII